MSINKSEQHYKREAGVLLHISSLPSNYGIGSLGEEARKFIDFLNAAGQTYWQVLPVNPTGFGDSPYSTFSSFAGNPYFIDLDLLIENGLLKKREVKSRNWGDQPDRVDYEKIYSNRFDVLRKAYSRSSDFELQEREAFERENVRWLDDYAMFMALKKQFDQKNWQDWPKELRRREPEAMKEWKEKLSDEIGFWKFVQYLFFHQWQAILAYAHKKNVRIIGDIPFYVSGDSSDVWADPEMFQLNKNLKPRKVAGVPPDDFSADGQLWGNPLYDWKKMEETGFIWWKNRISQAGTLYDLVRIDHFLGVVRCFAIPAKETTARNGVYKRGPGEKLTDAINSVIDPRKIIAEDLGVLIKSAVALRKKNGYPGMKIMQFGFNGDPNNDHFPENYEENILVYGGTHDNETILGYFRNQNEWAQNYTMQYFKVKKIEYLPWAMIRKAYQGVARIAVFQAQDLLCLGNEARMNFPSTGQGNWQWRLKKRQLGKAVSGKLHQLAEKTGRLPQEVKL